MDQKLKNRFYPELPRDESTPIITKYHTMIEHCSATSEDKKTEASSSSSVIIQKHYRTFLEDYIGKIEEILEKFEEIKKKASKHHSKSNFAKVSGTVVSSTGVALVMSSLWSAPFTAGSSLLFGAGGAVMSVTGNLTNVVTDYIDYKTTAIIMEDIKLLLKEKELFDIWMRKSLTNFNESVMQLILNGVSKELAVTTIIEAISNGAIDIMEKPNEKVLASLSTAVKLYRIEHLAVETLPVLGKTFHMTEKSFQFIYNILGMTGRTVPTLLKEFAKLSGVLSIAFAMADISLLIKDLCSEHPSIDLIDNVIEQMRNERNVLRDLIGILKAVEENKEGIILERAFKDIEMIIDQSDLLKDFVIVKNEELFTEKAGISVY